MGLAFLYDKIKSGSIFTERSCRPAHRRRSGTNNCLDQFNLSISHFNQLSLVQKLSSAAAVEAIMMNRPVTNTGTVHLILNCNNIKSSI